MSLISYKMAMSVIFCLSYDLSKELFIAFKVDIISMNNELKWTSFQRIMNYCHGCRHDITFPTESDNTCVVITLLSTE